MGIALASKFANGPLPPTTRHLQFGRPGTIMPVIEEPKSQLAEKPKRERAPKVKVDPKFVTAARELRDRWLEKVNAHPSLIGSPTSSTAKYDVTRAIESRVSVAPPAQFILPAAA